MFVLYLGYRNYSTYQSTLLAYYTKLRTNLSQKINTNKVNSIFDNFYSKQQFLFETTFHTVWVLKVNKCSVISIHALRERILPKTKLGIIHKCTLYFEQLLVRIEDNSCCWWWHNVVSGCFQSDENVRDTFDYVLELCTMRSPGPLFDQPNRIGSRD